MNLISTDHGILTLGIGLLVGLLGFVLGASNTARMFGRNGHGDLGAGYLTAMVGMAVGGVVSLMGVIVLVVALIQGK